MVDAGELALQILSQEPDVYLMPDDTWTFATAGKVVDGFDHWRDAKIASLQQIILAARDVLRVEL